MIRHNPVVDIPYEKRRGECEEIDQQRGQDDLAIDRPGLCQGVPEPVAWPGDDGIPGTFVELVHRLNEDRIAGVFLGECLDRHMFHSGAGIRHDNARHAIVADPVEDACPPAVQQQCGRQHQVGNAVKRPPDNTGREAGTLCRPDEQVGGEFVVNERETGGECVCRTRPVLEFRQCQQASKQRVIVC